MDSGVTKYYAESFQSIFQSLCICVFEVMHLKAAESKNTSSLNFPLKLKLLAVFKDWQIFARTTLLGLK